MGVKVGKQNQDGEGITRERRELKRRRVKKEGRLDGDRGAEVLIFPA